MKLYFTSLKFVILLTFFSVAGFSLASPIQAYAGLIGQGGYHEYCQDKPNIINTDEWVSNTTMCSLILNNSYMFLCGKGVDAVLTEGQDCVLPISETMAAINRGDEFPSGLVGVLAYSLNEIQQDPPIPTDLAFFINDTFSDTIFNTPAYAQDLSTPTEFFKWTTFSIWKFSRNLALMMSGVLLAVSALAVMFRKKLNPQITVSIYHVLPYVPIAIALVVLSYPIVAIAYNLVPPLFQISLKLGFEAIDAIALQNMIGPAVSLYTSIAFIATMILATGATGIGVVLSIPIVLMLIVMVLLLVFAIVKYLFEWIKTTITFVFLTAVFPFVAVLAILPGNQKLIFMMFKKILANILVIPLMTFVFLVGLGFILSMASGGGSPSDPSLIYVFSPNSLVSAVIKYMLGVAIIFNGFKIRGMLENALGVKGSIIALTQSGGKPVSR